jgi:hypothetical protein
VGYIDPALGEEFFNITVAQREAKVDPHRVLDNLGWKVIA